MSAMMAPPPMLATTPPTAPTPAQPRQALYTSQASYTPPSSAESPENYSPVSPRASWNVPPHLQPHRQLRPPKSPMYVPAVLRPTEKPIRHSPPKGNRMSLGTVDGTMETEGSASAGEATLQGLGRSATDEWTEEPFGQVTGAPSRKHWKCDSASSSCDDVTCNKVFSFFERRHHCRKCGNIFCGEHSSHEVPLDQNARFHPYADKFRACNACGADYREWEVARVSRSNSTNSRDSTTPGTPTVAVNRPNRIGFGAQKVGSLAKSVPSDWHWSTF
jgi:hypothetical protein